MASTNGPYSPSFLSNVTICVGITGIVGSIMAFIYVTKYMKLNTLIKSQLLTLISMQFLGCTMLSVTTTLITFFKRSDFWTCLILISPLNFVWPSGFLCTTVISISKFYKSWKAEQLRIANDAKMGLVFMGTFLVHLLFKFWLLYENGANPTPSILWNCQGVEISDEKSWTSKITGTAPQKHESTLLHTFVLNKFLTVDRSCTTKLF